MNPALRFIIQQQGIASMLRDLRDYCHERSNDASRSGHSGMGWYDLSQSIDGIIPSRTDEQLDGPHHSEREA